jgi:hypothetical protein
MLGAGSVWVLGIRWSERENAGYGSDLIRVDPRTKLDRRTHPDCGFQMVRGADEVWIRLPADGVFDGSERWLWTRVSVLTNEPSEPFEFDDHGLAFVARDALWSVGYDEEEQLRVSRLDPETLALELARSRSLSQFGRRRGRGIRHGVDR